MKTNFIERTNYFKRPTTWIKKILLILFVIFFVFIWDIEPNPLKFFLIAFVSLIILISRKDDLAVDSKYFYYYKTSLFPFLTKVERYEIDKIKSIRGRAPESWFWALYNKSGSWIELSLINDESISLEISIYKDDMNRIIQKVKELRSSSSGCYRLASRRQIEEDF